MRVLITALLLLAMPAFGYAQEQGDATDLTPQVEMQQTVQDAGTDADLDAVDTERTVETRDAPAEDAAVQDPTTRRWWWIVGAVVLGGIILAVLL